MCVKFKKKQIPPPDATVAEYLIISAYFGLLLHFSKNLLKFNKNLMKIVYTIKGKCDKVNIGYNTILVSLYMCFF